MLGRFVLVAVAAAALAAGAAEREDIWADYSHVQTSCDVLNCRAGGCLYEDCKQPLSCSGGLCYFRRCEEAICEGGACVFERVKRVQCPGGACHFRDMKTTLGEGYCTGGGCKLEGEDHPSDFAATLSE